MRAPAAFALKRINDQLKDSGYALKIFDAYRPYSITVKMWNLVHDRRFVANPAKGSGHNRGASVDLTIIKIATGKELNMGTDFDDFTEKASHSYKGFSGEILQNRTMLRNVMLKYGFQSLQTEWWHYILPKADEKFELLDLSFDDLKKLQL